ncbi:MAG: MBL fold metallo-hydrolase [Treponema sp.]|nr:MBL fold metallo-hydrolase [Treponema sp.]
MRNLLILGIVVSVMLIACAPTAEKIDGVYSSKVGQFEVFMLVEAERDGNTAILVDADEAILEKYIPEDGFKHTANAFLIKANGQNIMIDTGTGAGGILVEKIKKIGVEPEDINAVFITHLHGDHFGGLQRDGEAVYPNATIYLSERELQHFTVTNPNPAAVAALAPYDSQIETFEPAALNAEEKPALLPGIIPIAAFGHTPGHTLFQIENGNDKLLIIADLLHVALVQFAVPEISATFDIDPVTAAVVRREVLSYAAENKIPLGGMHIVYPGIGTVETDETGFKFTPAK